VGTVMPVAWMPVEPASTSRRSCWIPAAGRIGVAVQDPHRSRALDAPGKSERLQRFQEATVAQAQELIGAMGLNGPGQLTPAMLHRRIDHTATRTYNELYDWLEPGELLAQPPKDWAADWADADRFAPTAANRTGAHK
jgi:hypothetical protein